MAESLTAEEIAALPKAKLYEPRPYIGCPNCGGNCWGAINPREEDEPYVYRCHGATTVGNPALQHPGCGKLFVIPQGLIELDWDSADEEINYDSDEEAGEEEGKEIHHELPGPYCDEATDSGHSSSSGLEGSR